MNSFWSTNLAKFGQIFEAIAVFFVVLGVIFFIAGKVKGRSQRPLAIVVLLGPALLLLLGGLVIPAVQTIASGR